MAFLRTWACLLPQAARTFSETRVPKFLTHGLKFPLVPPTCGIPVTQYVPFRIVYYPQQPLERAPSVSPTGNQVI